MEEEKNVYVRIDERAVVINSLRVNSEEVVELFESISNYERNLENYIVFDRESQEEREKRTYLKKMAEMGLEYKKRMAFYAIDRAQKALDKLAGEL